MKPDASVWEGRELGPDLLRLDGRVALVTGAAQGIGEATAIGLARCGASLAICDRDAEGLRATADEIERLGRRAFQGVLDVRKGAEVDAFLSEVRSSFGVPDLESSWPSPEGNRSSSVSTPRLWRR